MKLRSFKPQKLQYYGCINPILSRALYWLAGLCNIIDGLFIVITGGFYYWELAQKSVGLRMWFMKRKNKKIAKETENNKRVACEIYTKKKKKGYLK